MRSIKALPESVRSSMRSGIILFDLTRVVEELVFNSLDADATKVIVAINVGTNYIKVTDNGCGITRDGLVLLGERYATSKFELLADMNTVPESFGFRGEALSSISDVSLLEVVTKAHGMPNGYRKVIKGCKCLYLGIDDDRQDVGTTVVVRDLFYNQPVRRRHLHSSPKKVLHSVKECILRIALVHLGTCFKIIDIESGDEILCLYPSSSPLPLLMSGFGTEVTSSLHKLDASEGELRLSGYISGPYETLSVKAFQYFYISSRYVSRGPLHKLLNQVATMHSSSDLLKADIRSQCGKRSRCQASPTYILNLTCPRAQYDLSFEPTKTCVAFKDWDPIFTFVKKAVSCFWSQGMPYGAPMSEEDAIWKGADALAMSDDLLDDYGLSKKRRMTLCHQAVLSSPPQKMPREEPKHMPYHGYSSNRSQRKAVQSKEYRIEMDFDCLTDNLLEFGGRSLPERKTSVLQESGNHLGKPNSYISSEDIYLQNKCSRELSSEYVDHLSDAKWNPNSLQTDYGTNNRLVVKEPSAVPLHYYDDDEEVDDDLIRPFLRSCSSHKGLLPVVGSKRGDNQFRFQADGSSKWLCMDDRVDYGQADYAIQGSEPWLDDAATVWSPPRNTTTFNLGTGSSFLSKGSLDSHSTGRECFTEDNNFWASPVASIECSKSSHRPSEFDSPASTFSSAFFVSKRNFKHCRDDGFDLSAGEVEKDIFNFDDMRYSSPQEDISFSSHMVASSFLKGNGRCKKNIRNSQIDSVLFPQQCDFLNETERTCSESNGKHKTFVPVAAPHHVSSSFYADGEKSKIAQCSLQDKHPRRSRSAPPSYRGKKKFFALTSWTTIKSGKSCYKALHNAPTLQEDSHLKHLQKSSGVDHLSQNEGPAIDSQSKSRHDKKKIIDKAEISDYEGEAAHWLDVYETDSGVTSKENQGALDFGGKWRNECHRTTSMENPDDHTNQDSILDISSGILHLLGDSLLPKSITKRCLEDSKVLQQVDKKFIPVVVGGILAIIDQHAADERIRLEDLRGKVLSGEMKTVTYLDAEQELVLPEIGYQLLNNYFEQIQKWGWVCNFHAQSSVSFRKSLNFLHNQRSVATLTAVPCILGVNLTDVDLLEFLEQLADTDGSSVIPPAVLRVLNFKACRGAIMFGDALLPSECSLIVEELKRTTLSFQCAHGRPTTAPLVNLLVLHKQIAKLGNWNHGSSGSWHGLSRHRPSLERAAQRLSSKGGQS
ncbi:DNA mismatch repair protein MLH3 isoform X2 [Cynara cardunculus var. scolymus]|uniref:DNA mismatch repair protein MLH3 isoform X2 n=1 Tax=Cynara cardunculus var. scolymus TaxID=59895 RepID=UPI000D625761|nr:DNA mismatch repair protein MLH3 isoform X2 [Cynara cardunculus var. scolymus]